MKKKIVIKLPVNHSKCGKKAMETASSMKGVQSVSLKGEDWLVVVGTGVDLIKLTEKLRRKVGSSCELELVSNLRTYSSGEDSDGDYYGDVVKQITYPYQGTSILTSSSIIPYNGVYPYEDNTVSCSIM